MISRWLSIGAIVFLVGCASHEKSVGKGLIVTPGGSLPGTVISVNPSARFAVVRFPIGQMPALNQHMNAYRQGLKVADLKISGPQRDVHTVADVVAGECRVGDEVRAD
ncbi:MAG: hypothetical protein DME57_11370 [Verrucomicrobia bacterium]|jgi:hypothetical protein|nr:MAG: hypothetical protein DME57_11370 [Verrucomicrobiota bacterium]